MIQKICVQLVQVNINVTCSLQQLTHAFQYLQCNAFFLIRKCSPLWVCTFNECNIQQLHPNKLKGVVYCMSWKNLTNYFYVVNANIQGAIDVLHIHIQKPKKWKHNNTNHKACGHC
jgi:hypothetical protein